MRHLTLSVGAIGLLMVSAMTACTTKPTQPPVSSQQPSASTDAASSPTAAQSTAVNAPPSTSPGSVAAGPSAHCLTAATAFTLVVRRYGSAIGLDTVHGYACADGFAYVNFHFTSTGNHATADLQYLSGQWALADRGVVCKEAPPVIYEYGCGN